MRVMVVDDERPARDELCYLLRQIPGVEIVAQAVNGKDAISKFQEHRPDAIFLDIQMPDASGVDVAGELIRLGFSPAIVFATAYDQYAVDAFDANHGMLLRSQVVRIFDFLMNHLIFCSLSF